MRARFNALLESRTLCRITLLVAAVVVCGTAASIATAQDPDPLMRFYPRATDMFGNEIHQVLVGEKFKLEVYAQDIRNPQTTPFPGVFAGTTKINFDDSLTPVFLPPEYAIDSFFPIAQLMEIENDAIYVSATSVSVQNPGFAPQKLFTIALEASAPGVQVFTPSFYETLDFLTLLYGMESELDADQILFESSTLNVVPEPSTWVGMLLGAAAFCGYGWRVRRKCAA